MKKQIASVAVAASMLGGAGLGAIAMTPMQAFAEDGSTQQSTQDTARSPGQWITDALSGLVGDGTITQDQSNAVAKALEDARPEHGPGAPGGPGGPGGRGGPGMEAAAKALNMTSDEVKDALKDGKTLSALAQDKGVDIQTVIDAIVSERTTHIDEQLTAGKITQDQADQRKADLTERVTQMVNSTPPERGPGGRGETPPADVPAPPTDSATEAAPAA